MSFFSELKRRNVFRMAALYVVASWLVLQVADVLVGVLGVPDWTMRFVLMLLLIGLPFALIFSWVYEMTPEGLKLERDVVREESVTAETGRKLNVVLISLLVAVLVVFAVDRLLPEHEGARPQQDTPVDASVAVLPFSDLSPARDQQYLADGMTEILLHRLAQVPELKVAARTSSFAFRERQVDVREIGESLGVAHVLEGSVQRVGEELRITAQLVRTVDGFEIWSSVFDKRYADLFGIQDEIAATVSASLALSLFGDSGAAAESDGHDIEAYDLYLQALAEYRKASVVSLRNADALLQRALEIEPAFAEAISLQAETYMWQVDTGDRPAVEGMNLAIATAERATELDPLDVSASVVRVEATGRLAQERGDIATMNESGRQLEQLVERFPGEVEPKMSLAGYYSFTGRTEKAISMIELALELDPLNPELHRRHGGLLGFSLRRYAEAREAYRESLRLEPEQPNVYAALAQLDYDSGDLVGYVQNMEQAAEIDPADPELPGGIAIVLYDIGLVGHAQRYHEQARAVAPEADYVKLVDLAEVRASGDPERILETARRIIDTDVNNRRFLYEEAVIALYRVHHSLGTVDAANAFMLERWPDWLTPELDSMPFRAFAARFQVAALMFEDAPREDRSAEAALHRRMYETTGRTIEQDHVPSLLAMGLEGDEAVIVDYLLSEIFVAHLYRRPTDAERWYLDLPLFAAVARHPEVAAGIDAWDRTFARARLQLERFLDERAVAEGESAD